MYVILQYYKLYVWSETTLVLQVEGKLTCFCRSKKQPFRPSVTDENIRMFYVGLKRTDQR